MRGYARGARHTFIRHLVIVCAQGHADGSHLLTLSAPARVSGATFRRETQAWCFLAQSSALEFHCKAFSVPVYDTSSVTHAPETPLQYPVQRCQIFHHFYGESALVRFRVICGHSGTLRSMKERIYS